MPSLAALFAEFLLFVLVLPKRGGTTPRNRQNSARFLGLGVAAVAHRAPDLDGRRHGRVGIGLAVEVDVCPSQRAQSLGPPAGQ
ncbi:hypothetical protein [Dactylosporangium darangshiense]|uniref:hypothetical protein n=1 Tax=Dactylosporangium darangshiense TaxID=579108 RepID=UPI0031EDF32B